MNELPFNACDYRCEHCLVTAKCAVFQRLQDRSLKHALDDADADGFDAVLQRIRESFRETETMIKQKARDLGIDLDELSSASPRKGISHRRSAEDDPLYRQALDFAMQTQRFLRRAEAAAGTEAKGYLDDIAWHHSVVAVKVYRTVGRSPDGEGAVDAANSAAVTINSLTICIMAFDYLAERCPAVSAECRELSHAAWKIKGEIKDRIWPARAA